MTNERIPLWAWIILSVCLVLLALGIFLVLNPQESTVLIKPYPTNISQLLSNNTGLSNLSGVVKLGS